MLDAEPTPEQEIVATVEPMTRVWDETAAVEVTKTWERNPVAAAAAYRGVRWRLTVWAVEVTVDGVAVATGPCMPQAVILLAPGGTAKLLNGGGATVDGFLDDFSRPTPYTARAGTFSRVRVVSVTPAP